MSIILFMKANKDGRLTRRLHVPLWLAYIAINELQSHVYIKSTVFFLSEVFLSACGCNMKINFVCLSVSS